MNKRNKRAEKRRAVRRVWPVLLLAAVALATAVSALAQVQHADTTQPIPIKAAKPPKPVKFAGAVISSNMQAITVRSRDNQKVVRTFTYSPQIQPKMRQIAQHHQFGDQVAITSEPGSNVALRIKGKPSR